MGLLADLIPTNLAAEKVKFLAAQGKYDPQFTYNQDFSYQTLTKYGLPQENYYQKAQNYLQNIPQDKKVTKKLMTEEEVTFEITSLCDKLQIQSPTIIFRHDQNGNFMLGNDSLKIRLPISFDKTSFLLSLNHEIQTHYLRRLNNKLQPWAKEKRPKENWIRTEEGLATYNGHRQSDSRNLGRLTFLYCLVDLAQKSSFQKCYQQALEFFQNQELAFTYTTRVKRGLTDTSQPGGFTKDIVYWEGYHEIKDWLSDPRHDLHDLYWGRISWREVEELRPRAITEGLIYPTFINDRIE